MVQRLGVFLGALLLATTSGSSDVSPMALLWVPPHSTVTLRQFYPGDGSGMAVFRIADWEPRELSARLTEHFQSPPWHPRATQWLNPGMTTSFTIGWSHQCACIVSPDDKGRIISPRGSDAWTGEWENDRGDVIAYRLRKYYYQVATQDYVEGSADYVPAEIIRSAQRRFHLGH
jgi:hypothetical protein